jgi:hypothetical protein
MSVLLAARTVRDAAATLFIHDFRAIRKSEPAKSWLDVCPVH